MAESIWNPCQFFPDGFSETPNVHDNFVYALAAHLEHRVLILHTQYRDGAGPYDLIDLRFAGLVAYFFDDVAAPSILLDVQRVDAEWVVEHWGNLFLARKNYGWLTIQFTDLADLSKQLTEQGVIGYLVMGSCGLDGFILSSSAEYRRRERTAEIDNPDTSLDLA
ncbi:hypothetical protein Plim_1466 [Planctopirus limnophila DSM 3776]|uniref:Uncharacterized protein n=1 Tax=Planctopirus limnophila (strain ATCC 43296 / DSM 3776 / IFAM 1008 / Mu 290) TaxID=521674 RepID=D5SW14_PLAL2|nr:hypothetical protein [Planctopirus limnophila]ADG67299.1 hypothetical protein Plim_1466 [Planctopirus limnophila DSM 3776]